MQRAIRQRGTARIAAAAGAALLALSLIPTAALATEENGTGTSAATTYATENAYINKVVWSSSSADFNRSFTYKFTPQSCNGYAATDDESDMPAITDQTINISEADKVSTSADASSSAYTARLNLSFLKTDTEKADNTFTHAGEYVYHVGEVASSQPGWIDSQAEYTLRVYVVNTDSGLSISGVTLNQNTTDNGTDTDTGKGEGASTENNAKIDPSNQNDPEDGTSWNTLGGWEYLSVYEPKNTLSLSMLTSGNYANKNLDFNYKATLKRAAYTNTYDSETESFVGVIKDAANETKAAVTFTYDTPAEFNLQHGWKVVFDGSSSYGGKTASVLPAGTMYSFTQEAETGYTNATQTKTGSIADALSSAGTTRSAQLKLDYSITSSVANPQAVQAATAIVSQVGDNFSIVTNSLDIIPTLAMLESAPFIVGFAVIGLGLAVALAFMLKRRAHRKEQAL